MNVTFSDLSNTRLDYLNAIETEGFYNGASRRILTLEMNPTVSSVDDMHHLLSVPANVEHITLEGDRYPVYQTKTVTQEVTNPHGDLETVQKNVVVMDEWGKPVVERYEAPTNVYDGYTMLLSVGIESKQVQRETSDAPAQYEGRMVVKLGKPTYIEKQLAKLGVM